jgi:hypothetical protein
MSDSEITPIDWVFSENPFGFEKVPNYGIAYHGEKEPVKALR